MSSIENSKDLIFMDDDGNEYVGRLEAAMPEPEDGDECWTLAGDKETLSVFYAGRWHPCLENRTAH